ncbi:hypothetical protein PV327_003735 [Microctonus hyperodae]|uniref:Uncharacterized protein n=1 Tax=Microctonus hyperodae TaxID=165561 RepID=A0AA39L169_MICHY|nr:hypothetical protein PV327_003735 [Microctonus hyperodae]
MGGRATHPQVEIPDLDFALDIIEREAEKLSDEGGLQVRDIKPEITPAKNLNVWHGNTFYPHLNTIKGADGHSHDRTILDCSACRPRAVFYSQLICFYALDEMIKSIVNIIAIIKTPET